MWDFKIQHTFDGMHCEKNLAINVIKTIIDEKDGKKVRQDLQALGIR
jgi:hypothetical protein